MSELPKIPKVTEAALPEAPETAGQEKAPALEKLRDKLSAPKKPESAEERAAKPRIDSLDKLIRIADEGIEGDLLGELEEEPEIKPQVKLPEVKKPAWLEEMEAAEAASQQQAEPEKERPGLALGAKLAGIREKLATKKAEADQPDDKAEIKPLKKPEKADFKAEVASQVKPEPNPAAPEEKPAIKPETGPEARLKKGFEREPEKENKNKIHNQRANKKAGTSLLRKLFSPKGGRRGTQAAVSEEIVFHEVDGAMEVRERQGGSKGSAKSRGRRWAGLAAAVIAAGLLLWLAAGLLGGGKDVVMYDICYASGYSRDPYCWEEQLPVQSDDLPSADLAAAKLRVQAAPAAKGQPDGVQLLGADGELLYQFANFADYDTLRGELARAYDGAEQAVWLCAEDWEKSRYNGYLDGGLLASQLLLVDVADGGQLFREETGEDELYLTSCGRYCYFYLPGQPERHRWLIFGRQEAEPARIICRSVDSWAAADTVYSFAYAGRPYVTEGEARVDIDRLCFSVGAEGLQVELKRYELTDAERERWDFVAKETIDIPYIAEVEPEEAV